MEIEPENYDAVLDVNLRGTLYMSQALIPHLRERKAGAIVNMSSVSAQRGGGVFGGAHYSAAKAAILGYTKACARELAPEGIRVNAVSPGLIDTEIHAAAGDPERARRLGSTTPLGREGSAAEVAEAIYWLMSDASSYAAGANIDVTGGR